MPIVTSGRFQSIIWEVTDFEVQFGDGNLVIGGLLCISEEGLKYFEVIGIQDGRGLQDKSFLGLLDQTDMDGLLGLDQKIIDLIHDLVHLPHNGQGGVDDDLTAELAMGGEVFPFSVSSLSRSNMRGVSRDSRLGICEECRVH